MHPTPSTIGIARVTYRLPSTVLRLDELHSSGRLRSTPDMLASFGFRQAYIAESESALDLAMGAVGDLLDETGADPDEIGVILYAGALASSSILSTDPSTKGAALHVSDVMELFRYPVSRIQAEFGMTRATAIGVDQQACASLFSALRIGRDMLVAEPDLRAALCVASDTFPARASREMIYNVVSDGACAALLRKDWRGNRILACGHVTKGSFWNASTMENEIVAAYFPTARTVHPRNGRTRRPHARRHRLDRSPQRLA